MKKEQAIINLVAESLGIDAGIIKRESSFVDDLGAGSLDLVKFIMDLEDLLEIEITDDVAVKWKTMGDVLDYLTIKRNNNGRYI
jgi:acyl carrier protein